jgi:hypothetical protein
VSGNACALVTASSLAQSFSCGWQLEILLRADFGRHAGIAMNAVAENHPPVTDDPAPRKRRRIALGCQPRLNAISRAVVP